ncbi:MAG: methionyl-tRNA formyltransferase [Syntrophomonadaceae bacterium]|nr:methionyl-tRNA formyltransferase [Syntrophomonadaceae bacterium]
MKIVFMGTSEFSIPSLQKMLAAELKIIGVVTQPDRPRGRGQKLIPSPIKEFALQHGLEIYQPERIRDDQAIDYVRSWDPDLIVVVSYGQIIPPEILEFPRLGCINVHASLLPRYRGAAPIQRAIMAGETISGVTIMAMDQGLDTGDIIMQLPVKIGADMDYGIYAEVLANAGADLLIDTLAVIKSGSYPRRKQDSHKATYAHMISREEERIKWQQPALTIYNQIRALSPRPAAYTSLGDHRFKIFSTQIIDKNISTAPGEITAINPTGIVVQCAEGMLEISDLQLAGKKRMASSEFLKGFKLKIGDVLGN